MKLKFDQPLRDRPGVLVHRKPDGKLVVIGDGNPFTGAELAALSPVIEPTRRDLPFTAEERAELKAAETRLAVVLRLREPAEERMWEAHDKCRGYEHSLGKVGERGSRNSRPPMTRRKGSAKTPARPSTWRGSSRPMFRSGCTKRRGCANSPPSARRRRRSTSRRP